MPSRRLPSLRKVLTVLSRGQLTLPAEMRKHLSIEQQVEHYSDDKIAAWDQADELSNEERQRILQRLQHAW